MCTSACWSRNFIISLSVGVIVLLLATLAFAQEAPNETDQDVDVLTRGPIHEAFADVSVNETQPGPVISQPVPEPIEEVSPEYRPEGDNVVWIPGYWNWDDDQNRFIWVSGIWRDIPPGRQWFPGYWRAVEGGNQYVPGYWAGVEQKETVYLPPPPEPVATGPSTPPVTPSHVWVDGHWNWYDDRYVWQSGYWLAPRPSMVWVPAHYIWSPRGFIFVGGYWDYLLPRRGVIFAPLYYPRPIYRTYGYHYTPRVVLNVTVISRTMFVRHGHRHYYFGDYYDVRYERYGYRPWFSRHATRYGYDPSYRYHRIHEVHIDRHWERDRHREFEYRRQHVDARPPHTYSALVGRTAHQSLSGSAPLGERLDEAVQHRDRPIHFTRVDSDHRREFDSRRHELHNFQTERRRLEAGQGRGRNVSQTVNINQPVRVVMPRSPIHGRQDSRQDGINRSEDRGGRDRRQDGSAVQQAGPRDRGDRQGRQPEQSTNERRNIRPQADSSGGQAIEPRRRSEQPTSKPGPDRPPTAVDRDHGRSGDSRNGQQVRQQQLNPTQPQDPRSRQPNRSEGQGQIRQQQPNPVPQQDLRDSQPNRSEDRGRVRRAEPRESVPQPTIERETGRGRSTPELQQAPEQPSPPRQLHQRGRDRAPSPDRRTIASQGRNPQPQQLSPRPRAKERVDLPPRQPQRMEGPRRAQEQPQVAGPSGQRQRFEQQAQGEPRSASPRWQERRGRLAL